MREKVLLICEECLSRNYSTTIKKEGGKAFQRKKYCKSCNKMTVHKISK
ncbi:MAG: 50S ribosomal protein L33 [Erysipelotrichia bacterium]|nr:50S ribosomal protein L33 [Erysipelotrichia bacterium]